MQFNCSSIYQCVTPLFYFSKMFGLAPFNLPSKNGILKTSFFDYLMFFLSELFFIYFFYTITSTTYMSSITDSSIFNGCATIASLTQMLIAIFSIFLAMFFLRLKIFEILKLINECDEQVFIL